MIETFLTNLVKNQLKFLNLTSDQMISDFSAHVGWSIAIPLLGQVLGQKLELGQLGLYLAVAIWVIESLYWKMISCGHLKMILAGTEIGNDKTNLIVNLLSRCTFPLLYLIAHLL